jgi:hypothetical protein
LSLARRFTLLILALPATGWAWEHEGWVWGLSDQPIAYQVTTLQEDSLPIGYLRTAIEDGFAQWSEQECVALSATDGGDTEENSGHKVDGVNLVSVDDPFDQVTVGVLAATVVYTDSEVVFEQDGIRYTRVTEADVVFNDEVDFATDEDIEAGSCVDQTSVRGIALHEVGHLIGLAHACPRGESCDSPKVQEATMHWLVPACDASRSTLADDDLHGLAALYGPYVPFSCGPEQTLSGESVVFGTIPFEVSCAMDPSAASEVAAAQWDFGDGGTTDDLAPTHTYEIPGRFDLQVCFTAPEFEVCEVFEQCPVRRDYVLSCTQPDPVVGWEEVDGTLIQLVNDTPVPPEGCFDTVSWTLYDSTNTFLDVIEEWEPVYDFPGPGDYRAVFAITGPAGTASAETFPHVRGEDVGDTRSECGCGSVAGFTGGPGLLLAVIVAAGRRRCRKRSDG